MTSGIKALRFSWQPVMNGMPTPWLCSGQPARLTHLPKPGKIVSGKFLEL